jgi:hypothetical protein
MRPILSLQNWVTKVKPKINSVEVHPQLSNNRHPVDGWCVLGGGATTFTLATSTQIILFSKILKFYFILFYVLQMTRLFGRKILNL